MSICVWSLYVHYVSLPSLLDRSWISQLTHCCCTILAVLFIIVLASLSLHVEECSTCEASVTLINHHNKSIYFHLWLKRGIDWHQDTYVHTYLWTVCTFLDANVFHYVCTTLTSRGQSWTKGSSEQIPFCTLMVSRVSETSHDWGEILTACVEKLRCLTASCCLTSHIRSGSH